MFGVLFITTLFALRLCNGSGYFKLDTPLSASDAQFACAAYGSSLATITTEDDNNIVSALCDANSDDVCWIGLNNQEREGIFEWNDGLNIAPFDVTQSWILWKNSSYHGRWTWGNSSWLWGNSSWLLGNSSYHGWWRGCVSTSDGYWEFDDCRSDRYPLCNEPPICTRQECRAGPPGPTGPQGEQGLTGSLGPIGNEGVLGRDGRDGVNGAQGLQGGAGIQGQQGLQGSEGVKGAEGEKGYQGLSASDGKRGPSGSKGPQGDAGPEGDQGQPGSWGDLVTGPKGSQGATGSKGWDGATGSRGARGSQGSTGSKGDAGPDGDQGPEGDNGDKGLRGGEGTRGPPGIPVFINILYHSYVSVPQYKTYDAADAYCKTQYGTSLAVVRSDEEYYNAREVCKSIIVAASAAATSSCYIGSNAYQYVDDILKDCESDTDCDTNTKYFVCLLPTPSNTVATINAAQSGDQASTPIFNDYILHRLIVGLCFAFIIISVVMVYVVTGINTPRKVDVADF